MSDTNNDSSLQPKSEGSCARARARAIASESETPPGQEMQPVGLPPRNSADHVAALDNLLERAVKVLEASLSATTADRTGALVPDHRIRYEATRLILAYCEGEPIKRQMINTVSSVTTHADFQARLSSSPALRGELRKLLDSAESTAASMTP